MHLNSLVLIALSVFATANAATAVMHPVHAAPGIRLDSRSRLALAAQPGAASNGAVCDVDQSRYEALLALPYDWLTDLHLYYKGKKSKPKYVDSVLATYAPNGVLTRCGYDVLVRDHPLLNTSRAKYEDLAGKDGVVTAEIFKAFLQFMAITSGERSWLYKEDMPAYSGAFSSCERKLFTYASDGFAGWKRFRDLIVPKLIFNKHTALGLSMMYSGDAWNSAISELSSFLGISISPESTYKLLKETLTGVSRDKFVSFALFKQFAGDSDCITAEAWPDKMIRRADFASIAGADNCVNFAEWHKNVLASK